jgi:simple sugar transport system permease protein
MRALKFAGNATAAGVATQPGWSTLGERLQAAVRKRPAGGIAVLFVLLQITCIAASLIFPEQFRYLNPANIRVTVMSIAPLGIMSLGVGILMIAGEFDLSVGALYSFCAVFAATFANNHLGGINDPVSPFVGMSLGILIGIAAGLVNGAVTIWFGIPSFITTLGAMLLWNGAVLLYNGASAVDFLPTTPFANLFGGQFWLMDSGFVWFLGLAVICSLVLHHHKLGNHFYAVGGNRQAAVAIGINPSKVKLIAFAITGGLAAFAGIIAMTRVSSVQPGGGAGMELRSIAACVIGGVALMGGRGSVVGMVLGTALVFTINDVLLLLRAPGFYFDMFVGALIVFAVILNHSIRRRSWA